MSDHKWKLLEKNKKCGKKENKSFIGLTITVSVQMFITNIHRYLTVSSKWLAYSFKDSKSFICETQVGSNDDLVVRLAIIVKYACEIFRIFKKVR